MTTQRQVSAHGESGSRSGTVRLGVVTAAALITFFQQGLLLYLLPLYFPARSLPSSSWETWGLYQVSAWIFAPLLSWLLARRMALRLVWALGLAVSALVFAALIVLPDSILAAAAGIGVAALLYGAAGAVVWTSGITLAQRVPQGQIGRANALMMVSLGLGSIAGPGLGGVALSVAQPVAGGPLTAYLALLGLGASLAIAGAALVAAWGEYPATQETSAVRPPTPSLREDLRLMRSRRFLALVIPLALLAGPVFQATNTYLAYRAAEPHIGLLGPGKEHGWAALQILSYLMQLVGGAMIGLVAGKRVSGRVAAALLGAFSLAGIAVGLAPGAATLFVAVSLFELTRQFARWLQTGYVSECVAPEHQSAAVSVAGVLGGLGAYLFMVGARLVQSPDSPTFSSTYPFVFAGALGLAGAVALALGRSATARSGTPQEAL